MAKSTPPPPPPKSGITASNSTNARLGFRVVLGILLLGLIGILAVLWMDQRDPGSNAKVFDSLKAEAIAALGPEARILIPPSDLNADNLPEAASWIPLADSQGISASGLPVDSAGYIPFRELAVVQLKKGVRVTKSITLLRVGPEAILAAGAPEPLMEDYQARHGLFFRLGETTGEPPVWRFFLRDSLGQVASDPLEVAWSQQQQRYVLHSEAAPN